MIGLGILIILCIWGLISLFLAWIIFKVADSFKTSPELDSASRGSAWHKFKRFLIQLFLASLIFVLPVVDQITAYPKWQELCATTDDFEWGPGINKKNALGREVTAKYEYHHTTIFPGIRVEYSEKNVYDARTDELLYSKPHFSYSARALIFLPSSSGDKSAPFLPSCVDYSVMVNGQDLYREIQANEVNKQ